MDNKQINLVDDSDWGEFESKLLPSTKNQELLKSAVGDLKQAIDKLHTIYAEIPTPNQQNNLTFLDAIMQEYTDSLRIVEETTVLAEQPTEDEKNLGITKWGRTEEFRKA